jgi:hypothetical protein
MTTQHSTTGQAGGAAAARVNPNPLTPADAKPAWDILDETASRAVADWFTARGRPVSSETILQWKRAGWTDTSAVDTAKAAGVARANIARAAAAPNGDAQPTKTEAMEPKCAQTAYASPECRGNADLAEQALLEAISCATAVCERISEIAAAVPSVRAAADADARPDLLLEEPENIAKLMRAASATINTAVEGLRQLDVLRTGEAAAAPTLLGAIASGCRTPRRRARGSGD